MLPPGGGPSNLRLFKPLGARSDPTGTGLQDGGPQSRVGVAELLERMLELGASDLHLTAGARPTVRVNGRLGQLEDFARPLAASGDGWRPPRPPGGRLRP